MPRNDLARLQVVLEAESSKLRGELEKVRGQFGRFERDIRRKGEGIRNIFRNALGVGAGFAVGRQLTQGLSQAVTLAADFEEEFSRVRAVTNATAGEIEQLQNIARSLGATTKFSAQQAAQGITFLGQAGFKTSEILAALPDTLDLAAAGGLQLGRAADIASNVLSGFRLEADETQRVVDVLATTASNSNTNIEQLAQAFRTVAPVAASLGISVESVASAIGVLGNAGLQAEIAGTGLRTVLASLAQPSKAAAQAIEGIGLSVEEVNPNVVDFETIIKRLVDAGLDAESAFKIFGREGAAAILALTGSSDDLNELRRIMEDVEGAAQDMARTMGDNLRGDFLALKSSSEELTLALADRTGLLGGLRTLTQAFTEFNRGLATLVSGAEQSIDQLRAKINDLRTTDFGPLGIRGGQITEGLREELLTEAEVKLFDQLRDQTGVEGIRTNIQLLDNEISGAEARIQEFRQKIDALPADAPRGTFQVGRATISTPFEQLNTDLAAATSELERLTQARADAFTALENLELDFDDDTAVEIPTVLKPPKPIKLPKSTFDPIQAEVDRLANDLATPVEVFRDATERFAELRQLDRIDAALHARAVGDAVGELFEAYQQDGPQVAFQRVTEELNRLRAADLADMEAYTAGVAAAQDRFDEIIAESDRSLAAFGRALELEQNPLQAIVEEMDRVEEALAGGFVSAETAVKKLDELTKEFNETLEDTKETADTFGESAFEKLTSSLEEALLNMDSLRDVTKGLAQDLAKLAIREFITQPLEEAAGSFFRSFSGGGGLGSLFKGLIPGFQSGADFTVGPQLSPSLPGVDNRLLVARVQDGEQVTITPRNERPNQAINVSMTVITPDANSFASRESQTQVGAAVRRAAELGSRNF